MAISIILGLGCLVPSGYFFVREFRSREKRKELNAAISAVTRPLGGAEIPPEPNGASADSQQNSKNPKSSNGKLGLVLGEPLAVGAGAAAYSLYDIYSTAEDKTYVLSVLEERYPHEMADSSPFEWYTKITDMATRGERSLQTYVSGFVGKASEDLARETLESHGYVVKEFDSLIHKDDDLQILDQDGHHLYDVSVKSYDSVDNFKQAVVNHPDSTHYMVNEELYKRLEDSGQIDSYAHNGITIMDGHWSHEELTSQCRDSFSSLQDAGDVAHHVPVVALALFGFKTVKNYNGYESGTQSGGEFSVNVGGDAARIGVSAVTAVKLGTIGASVGSVVPGIGTFVGGAVGAIAGGMMASSIVEWAKEKLKWGHIIKAVQHFGDKYESGLSDSVKKAGGERIAFFPQLQAEQKSAAKRLERYAEEVDPYSKKDITMPAILAKLDYENRAYESNAASEAVGKAYEDIQALCMTIAEKRAPGNMKKQKKIRNRYVGQVLLNNKECLGLSPSGEAVKLVERYESQLKSNPHHPYRLTKKVDGKDAEVSYKDLMAAYAVKEYATLREGFSFNYCPQLAGAVFWAVIGTVMLAIGLF